MDTLAELRAIAARHARGIRTPTPIPRVMLHQGCEPTDPQPGLLEPMLCVVLQGAKEVMMGEELLRYGAGCYAIATVELAVSGRISEASHARPYLAATLSLDRNALAGLIPELPPRLRAPPAPPGFAVSPIEPEHADAWLRLLRLIDRPDEVSVMAPMLEREILYRLLQGPQAGMIRQISLADSRLSQVRRAIAWIRDHFAEPLRVDDLAGLAGMSPAAFHRHFKAATAMSPVQFQKSLRLQQARRLLLVDHDAARAGFAVGYESASQFSREYARLFGAPPARDAQRLRADPVALEAAAAV